LRTPRRCCRSTGASALPPSLRCQIAPAGEQSRGAASAVPKGGRSPDLDGSTAGATMMRRGWRESPCCGCLACGPPAVRWRSRVRVSWVWASGLCSPPRSAAPLPTSPAHQPTADNAVKRRPPGPPQPASCDSPAAHGPTPRLTAMAAVATPTHRPQPSPMTNPETGGVIHARIPEKVSDTGQVAPAYCRRSEGLNAIAPLGDAVCPAAS